MKDAGPVKIESKLVRYMDATEIASCRSLTHRTQSMMRPAFQACLHRCRSGSQVVMAKDITGRVLSWALIDRTSHSTQPVVQLYTHGHYRRQGLGKRVMDQVKKIVGDTFIHYPYNKRSDSFFKSAQIKYPDLRHD